MPWVRIDDHFNEHPKLAKVGPLAWGVWLAGLAYCNRNLTDGFIPRSVALTLACLEVVDSQGRVWTLARTSDSTTENVDMAWVIGLLVEAGLWEEVPGGYRVHDFHDYQPSRQEVEAEREAARARMQRRRAAKKQAGTGSGEVRANIARTSGEVRAEFGRGSASPVPVPVYPSQENAGHHHTATLRSYTAPARADDDDHTHQEEPTGQAPSEPPPTPDGSGNEAAPSWRPRSFVEAELAAELLERGTEEQRAIHDAFFRATRRLMEKRDREVLLELLREATPDQIVRGIERGAERARRAGTIPHSMRYFVEPIREVVREDNRRLDYELDDNNPAMAAVLEERRRRKALYGGGGGGGVGS